MRRRYDTFSKQLSYDFLPPLTHPMTMTLPFRKTMMHQTIMQNLQERKNVVEQQQWEHQQQQRQ